MPSEYSKLSVEQLAKCVNCGKYDCFPELIGRIMPHIKAVAFKWKNIVPDTDDLVEEGVIAVFTAIKSYKSEMASFSTFANLCVDRAVLARVKSATAGKRIPSGLISSMEEQVGLSVESAEDLFIRKEEESIFNDDIRKSLSVFERKVLELFLEGESYSNIAAVLSVSVKSVDSALQRARKKIKNRP